ncbi:hypothetical protein GCM10027027_01980 [Neomicrococcus lactis]
MLTLVLLVEFEHREALSMTRHGQAHIQQGALAPGLNLLTTGDDYRRGSLYRVQQNRKGIWGWSCVVVVDPEPILNVRFRLGEVLGSRRQSRSEAASGGFEEQGRGRQMLAEQRSRLISGGGIYSNELVRNTTLAAQCGQSFRQIRCPVMRSNDSGNTNPAVN